ncbi:hypothetical protein [Bradyrhizobium sp.]|uniref:hypothetical protein n=1 Tax=Bradyrhizobium sp. TaxID=376 RepID=UPI001D1DAA61|nr:hypothetical protein [Bradyrhizobium sp.]MBI5320029.1 hypothetical protein [Bradyrhizobium sp.]
MKQMWTALAALAIGALLSPAHAVPPTATPSPGYDARLQESRASSNRIYTPAPRPPKPKPKKSPSQ